jgi:hypothetical protein
MRTTLKRLAAIQVGRGLCIDGRGERNVDADTVGEQHIRDFGSEGHRSGRMR